MSQSCQNPQPQVNVDYPETRKDTIVDDYHGTEVADPYRWLEDDYSEETTDWVKRQNGLTDSVLASIPERKKIEERLTELWNFERFGPPRKEGNDYYYFKNDGLQNQSVLYRVNSDGEDEVVIDPNNLSEDGTTSLGGISFSDDGKYMAYQISEGGSDWRKVKVMELSTLVDLNDNLDWIKFSGMSWYKDGFFYSRYPAAKEGDELSGLNEFHSLYYHKLGTSQDDDQLIYRDNEHPQRNMYAEVDDSEEYLLVSVVESTSGNALKLADLSNGIDNLDLIDVVDGFDSDYSYVTTHNDDLLFTTNNEAPNQKVVAINPASGSYGMNEVREESENTLRWMTNTKSFYVLGYLKDARSQVLIFDRSWELKYELELPTLGTVAGFRGNDDDDVAYYAFTSFTYPTTILKVDLNDGESEIYKKPNINIDLNQFETKQIWYTSKDGTKVPMFVTNRKDLADDHPAPTLLYGYGGFNIAIEPSFSVSNLILLENGGRHVVANIRGGGEFGKAWHKAGTLGQKQNVFDDFIGAAEHLVSKGMTTSELLAIEGGSNGGLLVGACMTQRPELFAVAFPRVGVLDMLRYHEFTIGWAWATDYGRSDDPEAFDYLIKYSPLHNVEATDYPATMIMTADHDDRVVPAHSFKFAAELQDKHTGTDPILIRIETSAGHGAGKPTSKRIEEESDKWGFMFEQMGKNPLN